MIKKIIRKNSLIKVFSVNGIIIFSRLLASFTVSKVSALYLGPSGYALVGNLKNILQSVLGVTATGFESGLIKYVAETKAKEKELKVVVISVVVLSVIISSVLGVFLFYFSKELSVYALKDASYTYVFRYLAFLLPLVSLNFLNIYIINGLQKLRLYTLILTSSNVINAAVTFSLVYYYNLPGAFFACILVPVISFISAFFFKDIRLIYLDIVSYFKNVSRTFLKYISTYLFMSVYSSLLMGGTYFLIRNKIISDVNIHNAGLWEATNKISSFYMMFFSSLFTLFLLPQLTMNTTLKGYYKIMTYYFKYTIPLIIVLFTSLFIFRVLVIKIFLTNAFNEIEDFFCLQLIGDAIKIIAFSFAYQFHAKKMVKFYLVSDFILYMLFYFLSIYLISYCNLKGVFYAYIVSVIFYLFVVLIFVFRNNSKYLVNDAE